MLLRQLQRERVAEQEGSDPFSRQLSSLRGRPGRLLTRAGRAVCGLILLLVVGLPGVGCSCWKDPLRRNSAETAEEIEKKKKELEEKKKQKPDFEVERLSVLPYDDRVNRSFVKPGHWTSAQQVMRANNFDFIVGRLDGVCVTRSGRPVSLPHSSCELQTTRSASLPKGTQKRFDLTFYPPVLAGGSQGQSISSPQLQTVLRSTGGREVMPPYTEPTQALKPYQYFFVVLAGTPDFYGFWNDKLPSIKPFRGDWDISGIDHDYVLVLPKGNQVTVPADPLSWTSTAYVLWDEFQPAKLTLEQQSAMQDWLHWGGQLIISGPGSLDLLASSSFAPYLPARGGKAGRLTMEQAAELNSNWSIRHPDDDLTISADKPPEIIELLPSPESRPLAGTAGLIWERRVGRGRIVVTAFSLVHRRFTTWPGYDNLVNGCLLRRPPRRFREQQLDDGGVAKLWQRQVSPPPAALASDDASDMEETGSSGRGFTGLASESWALLPTARDDARVTSTFRLFARDASSAGLQRAWHDGDGGLDRRPAPEEVSATFEAGLQQYRRNRGEPRGNYLAAATTYVTLPELAAHESYVFDPTDQQLYICTTTEQALAIPPVADSLIEWSVSGFDAHPVSGVGGWNDGSQATLAARRALDRSGGITVPDADFIAKMLGLYLLVLVPANWLLFRVLGHVEWAWAAIPVIATVGTIAVVRVAQLDIGFARSRTEIGILELQPGYARGHLTRYAGLYTSLSTSYAIELDEATAVAQPLFFDEQNDRLLDRRQVVQLNRGEHAVLQGLGISSNSTGMIHTEQFLDLGGVLAWQDDGQDAEVVNQTDILIRGAAVVRRTDGGSYQVAWFGDVAPNSTVEAELRDTNAASLLEAVPEWNTDPTTSADTGEDELGIRDLLQLATSKERLALGQTILVGWTDELLPGLQITPVASQASSRTVIVANLKYGELPAARSDANAWQAFASLNSSKD